MIWSLAVLPVALLALGTPIFVVFLAGAAVTFAFFLSVPPVALHQIMFGGLENYALLAVPFFIFAGELMGAAGIADRLIAWVLALIGRLPGSLGVSTVGACTLIGAISGSSTATVAAVSRTLYPSLIREGYGVRFSSGLISSSGSIDIVIPPSIAMILYGASAEQSIPKLFAAGVLPGLLIALLMSLFVVAMALRMGIPTTGRFDLRRFLVVTRDAGPALFMPVFILSGIYLGWFSPTEAGGFACLYAILVARYVYRTMSWQDVLDAAIHSALLTAQILVIVAAAALFSWILTVNGIPAAIGHALTAFELKPWAFPHGDQYHPVDRRLLPRPDLGHPGADAAVHAAGQCARHRPDPLRHRDDGQSSRSACSRRRSGSTCSSRSRCSASRSKPSIAACCRSSWCRSSPSSSSLTGRDFR